MVSFEAHWKRSMKAALSQEAKNAAIAATRGMQLAVNRLKDRGRGRIRAAGLGDKVANALRGQAYPKSGTSLNAAGSVYSNAPHIMDAFVRGATVQAKNGKFIAIPTRECPKGTRGRRKLTYPEAVKRFGSPKGMPLKGRDGYLALFPAVRNKAGTGLRRAGKRVVSSGRQQWVPFFILVRSMRHRRRLDFDADLQQTGRDLPGLIAASWPGGVS